MKKKQVLNLIRYFVEGNTSGFRAEAYDIAKAFDKAGGLSACRIYYSYVI